MSAPRPPTGAGEHGRRLWRSVLQRFDLDPHELVLLSEAVRTADVCEQLRGLADRHGPLTEEGRVHPAVVELRLQRITLARLIVALRIPLGDEQDRTQRRGTRGVYAVKDTG